ncbi:DUF4326 domain-containing protein [Mycobacteroides abscessus]|uniref:DUF4326 domain-containing protein n=1 Tax=Mycobacteroides abscessus TaxID=36809 RepID=UPI001A98DAD2|nr:DUF4326 domain-containing protein [Mycobacteroides abscessus]
MVDVRPSGPDAASDMEMARDRRATSVSWPVAVDERLRLLAWLSAREWWEEQDEKGEAATLTRPSIPAATRVLQNLILSQPLTGVVHLGRQPTPEDLMAAAQVNASYDWRDREPWFGRPRERAYLKPKRILLQRKRGFQLPESAVSVARPSRFGNPWGIRHSSGQWFVGQHGGGEAGTFDDQAHAHAAAVGLYRSWLDGDPDLRSPELDRRRDRILEGLSSLRDKDLACYCPADLDCHADELLVRANPD